MNTFDVVSGGRDIGVFPHSIPRMLPTPPASPRPNDCTAPEDRVGQVLGGHLKLTGILGVGAYGVVYTAVDLITGTPYAVKALNKLGLEPRQQRFQAREIELHHRASYHQNVVSMVEILEAYDCTYVVIEYCPEGDLFSNIVDQGKYVGNDPVAKSISLQILDAVRYCHFLGIYHRDLKPENILVTDGGKTVKVADFGLATTERITSDYGCGSTYYMSPECQQSSPRPFESYMSAPNDVWSLGVVLVNIFCGRNPWRRACMEDETFKNYMEDRNFLKNILDITDEFHAILCRIFEPDPRRRITLPELIAAMQSCSEFWQNRSDPEASVRPTVTVREPVEPVNIILEPVQPVQPVNIITPPDTPPLSPTVPCWTPSPVSPIQLNSNAQVFAPGPPASVRVPLYAHARTAPRCVNYPQAQYATPQNAWFALPQQIQRMACYLPTFQHPLAHVPVC